MVKSEWMFMTKQSEVIKSVAPFGVKEILVPPVIIADSNNPKIETKN
jgi:hypothetical protein